MKPERTIGRDAHHWIWIAFSTLLFGAFLAMTSEVREASLGQVELISSIDRSFSTFAESMRSPSLNAVAISITALGSGPVLTTLTVIVGILLGIKRFYIQVIHLFSVGLGSSLVTQLLKGYFERPRPDRLARLVDVQGFSYPSGHSLSSAAIYFTLAILLFSHFQTLLERSVLIGCAALLIAMIALSRVYLGVHYLSDTLAGVLVGIGLAAIIAAVLAFFEGRKSVFAIK